MGACDGGGGNGPGRRIAAGRRIASVVVVVLGVVALVATSAVPEEVYGDDLVWSVVLEPGASAEASVVLTATIDGGPAVVRGVVTTEVAVVATGAGGGSSTVPGAAPEVPAGTGDGVVVFTTTTDDQQVRSPGALPVSLRWATCNGCEEAVAVTATLAPTAPGPVELTVRFGSSMRTGTEAVDDGALDVRLEEAP